MTGFADQLMIRYANPTAVDALLVPAGDSARARVRALLAQVYEPRLLNVELVDSVTVTSRTFQVPVVASLTANGSWEKVLPQAERALGKVVIPDVWHPSWIDLAVEATVSVRVSATAAMLDAIDSTDLSGLSQADFVARFQLLDLADLLAASRVTSYEQLQADFPRLYRLHYGDPPAFDPNDPATARTYRLRVSVLFFATTDLVTALRELRRCREALDARTARPDGYEGGDLLGASAWIAVFPAGGLPAGITEAQVAGLFATEHATAVFETV